MKIRCLACGHSVELDEAYDDYEGPIRCWVCGAVFEIRAKDGCVKAARGREHVPSASLPQAFAGAELAEDESGRASRRCGAAGSRIIEER
jgi:hypothetical protein